MNTWASSPAIDSSQLRRRGATMFAKRIPLGAASIALAAAFATSLAQAQISDGVVKIGVLNDMSSVYSDITGPGSVAAARKACSPNTIHWTYDTWMLANGTGSAIVKSGGSTWFFLTADYAFGLALERDTEAVVVKNGGKVLGRVRHPLNTQDFSSFLLQAQASKAKIIGLANAGGDTIKIGRAHV